MDRFRVLVLGLLAILMLRCGQDESNKSLEQDQQGKNQPLFVRASSEQSKIRFKNALPESTYMNGLFYEYYYNGSGVAAGDFDNNGFDDIYFVATMGDNQLYLNNKDNSFKDVTPLANIKGKAPFQTGVTTLDINNDGWLDIYICASGRIENPERRKNELYLNLGTDKGGIPHFREAAKDYNLDLSHFSTQASFFDYDRDGDLDMFLINHEIDVQGKEQVAHYSSIKGGFTGEKLFRNDDGKYRDVTDEMGIVDNKLSFGLGLAIGDINNDGWPDVYVSHDFFGKDHCYINQNGKSFKESSVKAMNHVPNFSMGNDMADFNNDGWMDIIAVDMMSEDNYSIKTSMSSMQPGTFHELVDMGQHHQYMFNALQMNHGTDGWGIPRFSDIAQFSGTSSTDWSWGPLFFDMDNDGYQDLFVSNGIKRDFRNNDFVNYMEGLRREMDSIGHLDEQLYVQKVMGKIPTRYKPNYFFRNLDGMQFKKMNGTWDGGELTCSNGAAYADFDNDGDLDLVVNNTDSISYIQWNQTEKHPLNRFLKIKLEGSEKNKLGIGAKVIVKNGSQLQVREHYLTRGFQSSMAPGLYFGLGKTENIDEVAVVWPDGKSQILQNIKPDQTLALKHSEAKSGRPIQEPSQKMFTDITDRTLRFMHKENQYDDFEKESLLPHKMSQQGPAFAVGDINADGLDDFYLGGALGQSGNLFLQNPDGSFSPQKQQTFARDKGYEDVGAAFFDADSDGDMDLYVVSGGNEREENSSYYQDRFYENRKGAFFKKKGVIPGSFSSGSCVRPYDYDNDGDMDLFIGGRQVPGKYPLPASSHLLENQSPNGDIRFVDVSDELIPELDGLGMVTDAVWADIDGDGLADLTIVGEWMGIQLFKNTKNGFINLSRSHNLQQEVGWWNSIVAADFDRDGDMDMVCGNLGQNYKYKADKEETFDVYAKDFDRSGNLDIVLGYYNEGDLFPLRGRECSSNQMPFIKKKFESYDAFGKATLGEVYGEENLDSSIHYKANNFSNMYFENRGGKFIGHPLPAMAQLSSINALLPFDYDGDGILDILTAGNLYGSEVETPRSDASFGLLLKGDGKSSMPFVPIPATQSGILVDGEVKHIGLLSGANGNDKIIFVRNNEALRFHTSSNLNSPKR